MSRGGGASLISPLLTPAAIEQLKRYGTLDIDEAIRREMAEVAAEERTCAWPGCEEDLSGEHPQKQYCGEHRAQRDRESRGETKGGESEVRGATRGEIFQSKIEEMRQMTDEMKTCSVPGCEEDTATRTGTLCEQHLKEAKSKGGRKSASICGRCEREDCDERGQRQDKCLRFTLNSGVKPKPAEVTATEAEPATASPAPVPAKKPAKKKAKRKPAQRKSAGKKAHHKTPPVAPVQSAQDPPRYEVGLDDYVRMVPMIRTFKTNEEAAAYCEGFFAARKIG